MKYTARHIRRFLETGQIDATLWKNHFPSLLPTQVPGCDECSEFAARTCAGGRDPVACFLAKKPAAETAGSDTDSGGNIPGSGGAGQKKAKKRDPMLGLGAKDHRAHGTAKPRDESKM